MNRKPFAVNEIGEAAKKMVCCTEVVRNRVSEETSNQIDGPQGSKLRARRQFSDSSIPLIYD